MPDLILFDYTALDTETKILAQQRASEIKTLMRRTAQDIIEIGHKLIEVKAMLGHGQFGEWLTAEFGWSYPTATRFMQVANKFVNLTNLEFAPSALYMLSAPSTPNEARDEALSRADAGEVITHKVAKKIVQQHREEATRPERQAPPVPRRDSAPFVKPEVVHIAPRTPEIQEQEHQQGEIAKWLLKIEGAVTFKLQAPVDRGIQDAYRAAILASFMNREIQFP